MSLVLNGIEHREQWAENALWDRFHPPLLRLFRGWFGTISHPVADEQDLAAAAMLGLYEQIRAGDFHAMLAWGAFWKFAHRSAQSRFADQRRGNNRLKRSGGHQEFGSGPALDALPSGVPQANELLELKDELLALLELPRDNLLREIVQLLFDGNSKQEIADRLGCTVRTVNGKLQPLLPMWLKRLDGDGANAIPPPEVIAAVRVGGCNRGAGGAVRPTLAGPVSDSRLAVATAGIQLVPQVAIELSRNALFC
jgi:DNA-directed RNA polymerase specialized sigma24 family protein